MDKLTFAFSKEGGDPGEVGIRLRTCDIGKKKGKTAEPFFGYEPFLQINPGESETFEYILDGHTGRLNVALDLSKRDYRKNVMLSYLVTTSGYPGAIPAPTPAAPSIPLPPSLILSAAAIGALGLMRWRRRAA